MVHAMSALVERGIKRGREVKRLLAPPYPTLGEDQSGAILIRLIRARPRHREVASATQGAEVTASHTA